MVEAIAVRVGYAKGSMAVQSRWQGAKCKLLATSQDWLGGTSSPRKRKEMGNTNKQGVIAKLKTFFTNAKNQGREISTAELAHRFGVAKSSVADGMRGLREQGWTAESKMDVSKTWWTVKPPEREPSEPASGS